ncbi:hypothetical protein S245_062521, partial [Arachis hypogaea]
LVPREKDKRFLGITGFFFLSYCLAYRIFFRTGLLRPFIISSDHLFLYVISFILRGRSESPGKIYSDRTSKSILGILACSDACRPVNRKDSSRA